MMLMIGVDEDDGFEGLVRMMMDLKMMGLLMMVVEVIGCGIDEVLRWRGKGCGDEWFDCGKRATNAVRGTGVERRKKMYGIIFFFDFQRRMNCKDFEFFWIFKGNFEEFCYINFFLTDVDFVLDLGFVEMKMELEKF